MVVIRHQAITLYPQAIVLTVSLLQIEEYAAITIVKEDVFAVIAPLNNMKRNAGNNETRDRGTTWWCCYGSPSHDEFRNEVYVTHGTEFPGGRYPRSEFLPCVILLSSAT